MFFTAGLSLTTGVLFGLAPAIQSTRPDLVTELRNNSGKLSGGRGAARFRSSLVTAQIALSMALLISAGLFIKSLRNVSRVDLGINVVYSRLINDVDVPLQKGMSEKTLGLFRAKKLLLSDGRRGQSSIHREAKTPILMLFSITAIVLLIACANIANLLLARAANSSANYSRNLWCSRRSAASSAFTLRTSRSTA